MDETLYLVIYPILLISVPIYFVLSRKEAKHKRNIKWCIVLLLITIIGVEAIDTFTIKPSRISGNGNPGILVILANVPYFIGFQLSFGFLFGKWIEKFSKIKRVWIFGTTVLLLGLFIWISAEHAQRLYETLAMYHEPNVYRGRLNQYTNTVFINLYTLFTTIFLNMMLVQLIIGKEKKE
ncbi:hypothetical protein [Brevibacillus sp. SYSU BS000544]|uniref:hypothetical protein n=1 Tax=Brevibacillus sp. SYSU BS000544 TaxID=3416443 RepID=UPI003CE4FB50